MSSPNACLGQVGDPGWIPASAGMTKPLRTSRGFTLAELLVAIAIASVMMFAFTMPFVAERIFWRQGNQQMEAQRDAQLVMHAISRIARECKSATVTTPASGQTRIALTCPPDASPVESVIIQGGPGFNAGKLQITGPTGVQTPIDGVKSKVMQFTADEFSAITPKNPLLHLTLQVDHKDSGTELLETRILLRNAS